MGLLAMAIARVTLTQVCTCIVTVAGAAKLVLDTVETAQRVKKAAEEKK